MLWRLAMRDGRTSDEVVISFLWLSTSHVIFCQFWWREVHFSIFDLFMHDGMYFIGELFWLWFDAFRYTRISLIFYITLIFWQRSPWFMLGTNYRSMSKLINSKSFVHKMEKSSLVMMHLFQQWKRQENKRWIKDWGTNQWHLMSDTVSKASAYLK